MRAIVTATFSFEEDPRKIREVQEEVCREAAFELEVYHYRPDQAEFFVGGGKNITGKGLAGLPGQRHLPCLSGQGLSRRSL